MRFVVELLMLFCWLVARIHALNVRPFTSQMVQTCKSVPAALSVDLFVERLRRLSGQGVVSERYDILFIFRLPVDPLIKAGEWNDG
jgi:hypothetical protein